MSKTRQNPKMSKFCAFWKRWCGDAGLRIIPVAKTMEFETQAPGKCALTGASLGAASQYAMQCKNYAPCVEVERLL